MGPRRELARFARSVRRLERSGLTAAMGFDRIDRFGRARRWAPSHPDGRNPTGSTPPRGVLPAARGAMMPAGRSRLAHALGPGPAVENTAVGPPRWGRMTRCAGRRHHRRLRGTTPVALVVT